jgi:hypothetical protein
MHDLFYWGIIQAVVEMFLVTNPSIINKVHTLPPLGLSDHDVAYIEADIWLRKVHQQPRKILRYDKANWDNIRSDLEDTLEKIINSFWFTWYNLWYDQSMWPRLKSPPKIILVLDAWFILLRDNSSCCRDVLSTGQTGNQIKTTKVMEECLLPSTKNLLVLK